MKNFQWKQAITLAVLVAALIYILPTLNPEWWPRKTINLGLDLQGGMHLILEVETEKAVETQISGIGRDLEEALRKERVRHTDVTAKGQKITVLARGEENIERLKQVLDKDFAGLAIVSSSRRDNTLEQVLSLPDDEVAHLKKMAVEQALETIRNRIDQFGVSEPVIHIQGKRQILVQLPGITDPQRAKDLIGKTALLEFRLVDEENDVAKAVRGQVPPGSELLYEVSTDPDTGRTIKTPLLVKRGAPLTGADLSDARVQIDAQYNEPYVSITFNRKGANIFAKITEENLKKRLAIVLDNHIHSAPVIQDRITGGAARITGSFTMDEAHDLAIVLRAGALPAPVRILEERTVGPSLGKESIDKGLMSMYIGGLIVVLFMAIYYRKAGLIADAALVFNILLIAAGLAALGATLTLPGIAGIILTIGMAVDANVIIFERIREEVRTGKTPRAAVAAGFDRAALTVLDANITTLIAAVVLFQFGTGPVKGFAVTLSLGVLASLFTALVVSRQIFDLILTRRKVTHLSI
ncbi:MAG: protein translocase subunit SecD [Thermodesulfobacteriota bacterium]|nr:protein translocase subunit SecD [Thermodesulfobacteriota bacterium]